MNLLKKIYRKLSQAPELFIRKHFYFTPYYVRVGMPSSVEPEIYSKSGRRLHVFFYSNRGSAYDPYGLGRHRSADYILWDRYNFGLKTHFYSEIEAFLLVGKPDRRFANIGESRSIIPQVYKKFIRNRSYFENEFEFVFTHDDEILSTFNNAKYVPYGADYWCGIKDESAISPDNYQKKDKNISIIASNKRKCRMHLVRQETARKCFTEGLADAFGTFTGRRGGTCSY